MKKTENILLGIQIVVLVVLAILSYAYVDLNLTLTKNVFVLKVIARLQLLGYYMRTQSTILYIALIFALFATFGLNMVLFFKNKLSLRYLKTTAIMSFLISVTAYPFLSSDIFNYIFDARIMTLYHSNPYFHKPLDYPSDDWIRFMRWTHRYSPYGPIWLLYTTVPSILGFGKFLITLFAFKLSIGVFHLINSYLIYKTLQKINKNKTLIGTAFYALNPLFIIEGIVNAHNDIFHLFFIILSIYYLANSNKLRALASVFLGSSIKYIAILSSIALTVTHLKRNNQFKLYIYLNLFLYTIFTYIFSSFRVSVPFISSGSLQTQFQPWYLFWTLPLIAFVPTKIGVFLATALGLSSMLRYVPFLYYGEWSKPSTTEYMQIITVLIPIALLVPILIKKSYEKIFK